MKQKILFILILLANTSLFSQQSKPNTLTASYIDTPIKLDGKLDESCWLNVTAIENFIQREQKLN